MELYTIKQSKGSITSSLLWARKPCALANCLLGSRVWISFARIQREIGQLCLGRP